jgi:hypothetical protein
MKTRDLLAAVLLLVFMGSSNSWAQTDCRVLDPKPPLNVRTTPNGGTIVRTLPNGIAIWIRERDFDNAGREWVYVSNTATGKPIGWVYRWNITCGVSSDIGVLAEEQGVQRARRAIVSYNLYGGSIQCLYLDPQDPEKNSIIIHVYEVHNTLCAGDPNTGPRVGSLLINLDTGAIRMESGDGYGPLRYGGS